MNDNQGIMSVEKVLPEDFNGVFNFTNWTDEEFVGIWGSKEYHFSANSTSPMIIPDHSPLQIQQIRKKFAKDLAECEFYKSSKYEGLRSTEGEKREGMVVPSLNSFQKASTYSLRDLEPFIQKCLIPLEVKRAAVTQSPKLDMEEVLSKNEEGHLNTAPAQKESDLENLAKGKASLKEKAGF